MEEVQQALMKAAQEEDLAAMEPMVAPIVYLHMVEKAF